MAQFGRPDSDIAAGNWTTAPLYSKVNESSYNDGNYIQLNNSAQSDADLGLSDVTDPNSSSGHWVRIRAKKTGTGTITLTGYLMEGSNVRATISITLTTSFNTTEYNLSGAEADSISNYSNVFLRLRGVANSSSRYVQVSWCEFEVPNVTYALTVNDAYSLSAVEDSFKLAQVHNLQPADTYCLSAAEVPNVTKQSSIIGIADLYCVSQSDSLALTKGTTLGGVQDAYCTSQVDAVLLSGAIALVVNDAYCTTQVDSPTPFRRLTDGFGGDIQTYCDAGMRDEAVQGDYNYGTSPFISICNIAPAEGSRTSILKFDLSTIPVGAVVVNALLYLYTNSVQVVSHTVLIHAILAANAGWVEGTKNGALAGTDEPCWAYKKYNTVRWAGDAGGDSGRDAGCSVAGTDFNATEMGSFVQASSEPVGTEHAVSLSVGQVEGLLAADYGLLVRTSTVDGATYNICSAEHATTGYRPKLVVEYYIPAGLKQLTVQDASCTTQVDTLVVTKEVTLVVADSYCTSQVDAIDLTGAVILVVNDASCTTQVDAVVVVPGGGINLVVADVSCISFCETISYFPQILKPASDVTDGTWTNQAGSQVDLYDSVNEANPSDSDYIQSELDPISSPVVLKLAPGIDPQSSAGHTLRVRVEKEPNNSQTLGYLTQLRQAYVNESNMGTLIAEWTDIDLADDVATIEHTLTGAQADSVTDYTSLYVRVVALHEPGVHRLDYHGDGPDMGAFGDCNGYIAKFAPDGKVKWIGLIGGPNYTRIYGVRVDAAGNVFVAGRCGPGLFVTAGVMQPLFAGYTNPTSYGWENGFVVKFGPNGNLIWATYNGTAEMNRDIAISSDGSIIVVPLPYVWDTGNRYCLTDPKCRGWAVPAFANAYQSAPANPGVYSCSGVLKINAADGTAICATYLSGNGTVSTASSVAIGSDGGVYLLTFTTASNLPVTAGCMNKVGSQNEYYLCKFSSDLSTIIWGTYLGCTDGNMAINTHNLWLDNSGNVFVGGQTNGTDLPTTPGAYMENFPTGMSYPGIVARFNQSNGVMTACTYMGDSNSNLNQDGIRVDSDGNVWCSAGTGCTGLPTTTNAYSRSHSGGTNDCYVFALSNDLTTLVYATYLGGAGDDQARCMDIFGNKVLIGGTTDGSDYPIKNAYQGTPTNADAVVTLLKIDDVPTSLLFSTYLGGSHSWSMGRGVAICVDGSCIAVGGTQADNFPTHD